MASSSGQKVAAPTARDADLPAWLNGQTVAILGTVFTVAIGIAAMILVSTTGIRTEMGSLRVEMNDMRRELTAGLDALDTRLRGLETIVLRIGHRVTDLEERASVVEAHTIQPVETAHVAQQPDR